MLSNIDTVPAPMECTIYKRKTRQRSNNWNTTSACWGSTDWSGSTWGRHLLQWPSLWRFHIQIRHLSLTKSSSMSSAGITLLIYRWGIILRKIRKTQVPIDPDLDLELLQCSALRSVPHSSWSAGNVSFVVWSRCSQALRCLYPKLSTPTGIN